MSLVSVIIPTYNRSTLLKQALESVLAAERDGNELEIIVVDDGSTDDTAEVVKSHPVVYLPQKGGLGPAGARNVGIDAAHGDYIAFLDDDDVWLPTKLTAQVRLLHDHPEYGMVVAQLWCANGNLAARWGPFPPDIEQTQLNVMDMLRLDPQIGALLVRRSLAQKIPFDSTMRWMEDTDWIVKMAECAPVGYTNVPVMVFRVRPRNTGELWLLYRGMAKVFYRHTHTFSYSARLRSQSVLWKWQGWYIYEYLKTAHSNVKNHQYFQSAKAIAYALRISPPQLAILLARPVWEKLTRSRSISSSSAL